MINVVLVSSIIGFVTFIALEIFEAQWCRFCVTFWASLIYSCVIVQPHMFAVVLIVSNLYYYALKVVVVDENFNLSKSPDRADADEPPGC